MTVLRIACALAAATLALGCGAAAARSSTTRYVVGDRIVYRYAGTELDAPVELEERITAVDGLRLRIEVTARRGEEVRRWAQIVTDTEENRRTNHVDALYEIDGSGRERLLANEDGEDLRELYDWTLPDVEWGEPGEETTADETRTFAGRDWSCRISRTALPSIGPRATIELSDCEGLVWTHGPGRLLDGDAVLWSVDVLEVGPPTGRSIGAESGP